MATEIHNAGKDYVRRAILILATPLIAQGLGAPLISMGLGEIHQAAGLSASVEVGGIGNISVGESLGDPASMTNTLPVYERGFNANGEAPGGIIYLDFSRVNAPLLDLHPSIQPGLG